MSTEHASTVITHEGHEYRPAAEVQPREGDRVAMLDRLGERPWVTIEGLAVEVGDDLRLGGYALRCEYGWTMYPVRIVQRTQPAEPTGLGAVVRVGGEVWVRVDVTNRPWRCVDVPGARWEDWAYLLRLGPVEVLSDGWTGEP